MERVDYVDNASGRGAGVSEFQKPSRRASEEFGLRADDVDIVDADGGRAFVAGALDDGPDGAGLRIGLVLDDEYGRCESGEVESLKRPTSPPSTSTTAKSYGCSGCGASAKTSVMVV